MTVSIRPYLPFEVVYFETFDTEAEAVLREKYFKTPRGRVFLKSKLSRYPPTEVIRAGFNARPADAVDGPDRLIKSDWDRIPARLYLPDSKTTMT